jgi:TolA-binding protein
MKTKCAPAWFVLGSGLDPVFGILLLAGPLSSGAAQPIAKPASHGIAGPLSSNPSGVQQIPPSSGKISAANTRVSVKALNLSRAPTTEELMAAGQLGGLLYPTHELKDERRHEAARWDFGHAIEAWNRHEYPKAVALFREHVKKFPDSPWAGEAELHIGCDGTYNGRYTEAEDIFRKLIAQHQGSDHEGARMLLGKARQRLGLLKVEQNNLPEAEMLFTQLLESPDWRLRTYASHWIQRLSRLRGAQQALLSCGNDALAYLLEKESQLARTPDPTRRLRHRTIPNFGVGRRNGCA